MHYDGAGDSQKLIEAIQENTFIFSVFVLSGVGECPIGCGRVSYVQPYHSAQWRNRPNMKIIN
jgi:hypothetical protein